MKIYNNWKVVGTPYNLPYKAKRVACVCICGTKKDVLLYHLKSGASKGCRRCSNVKHGGARKTSVRVSLLRSTYSSYINMRTRCLNPSTHRSAKCYTDRPLKLCRRWLVGGFKQFLDDMGIKPSFKHSIDRIDNAKGYSLSNCRWATKQEQVDNSRLPRLIKYKGVARSIRGWEKHLGLGRNVVSSRLRRGWTVSEALK